MTMNLHKLAMTTAIILGLGVAPALADCHGDWDTNQDTMLDQNEFGTAYGENGWFGNVDADADGFLSEDEYTSGLYRSYDSDQDGLFSEVEQKVGFTATDDYSAWDRDADGALSEDEFGTGIREDGSFGEWDSDRDGLLSENEFGTGVYGTYDADRSGFIDESESTASCDDYGEEGFWDF